MPRPLRQCGSSPSERKPVPNFRADALGAEAKRGSIGGTDPVLLDTPGLVARIAAPATRLVTLTVTEKGYLPGSRAVAILAEAWQSARTGSPSSPAAICRGTVRCCATQCWPRLAADARFQDAVIRHLRRLTDYGARSVLTS